MTAEPIPPLPLSTQSATPTARGRAVVPVPVTTTVAQARARMTQRPYHAETLIRLDLGAVLLLLAILADIVSFFAAAYAGFFAGLGVVFAFGWLALGALGVFVLAGLFKPTPQPGIPATRTIANFGIQIAGFVAGFTGLIWLIQFGLKHSQNPMF